MTKGPILFTDEGHIYQDDIGLLTSVSRITNKYKKKFNPDTAIMKAYRNFNEDLWQEAKKISGHWANDDILEIMIRLAEQRHTAEEIKEIEEKGAAYVVEWAQRGESTSSDGTAIHFVCEDFIAKDEFVFNPFDNCRYRVIVRPTGPGYDNKYVIDFIKKNYRENVVVLEALCVDHANRLAGQADILWLYWTGSQFLATIGDYKTDAKLSFSTFDKSQVWPAPFSYIADSKANYYSMKMSCYANFLLDDGIKTIGMYISHVPSKNMKLKKPKRDKKMYLPLPIRLKESKLMINHFAAR